VNKLLQVMLLGVMGLVILAIAGPIITRFIGALVPLVLVVGVVYVVVRLVNARLDRW